MSHALEFAFRDYGIFKDWLPMLERNNVPAWLVKPLGDCVVCMAVWISIASCMYFQVPFINAVLVILASNFLVRFFTQKLL